MEFQVFDRREASAGADLDLSLPSILLMAFHTPRRILASITRCPEEGTRRVPFCLLHSISVQPESMSK